jgi:hypothetical protein
LRELGLASGASASDVKAAYKMLVKVWHPDRFPGDERLAQAAEVRLKAINTAYSYLTGMGYEGGPKAREDEGAGPGTKDEDGAEDAEPKRPASVRVTVEGRNRGRGSGTRILIRILVVLAVVGIGVLALKIADSLLLADTRVGRDYAGFRAHLVSDFEVAKERTWGELKDKVQGMFGRGSGSDPVGAPVVGEQAVSTTGEEGSAATVSEGHAAASEGNGAAKDQTGRVKLLPYATVDMTRDEVVSALGRPTSSSEDKLMYGASELNLKDGKVVGWKIAPQSGLRVKLWPEGPVDTSLRTFTVGSTKDEVLVVQGTPSSFTQDRFEYGSSVVYFRENRVLVWKEGSVRLRAVE